MAKQPIEIFNAFRESMLSKTDVWKDLISDDVSLTGPLAQVNGKDSFIAINTPFFESVRRSEIHQILEKGHYIITQVSTHVEMPTGKTITLDVCEWYEIKEGKILSLRVYFDTAEFRNEMMPA